MDFTASRMSGSGSPVGDGGNATSASSSSSSATAGEADPSDDAQGPGELAGGAPPDPGDANGELKGVLAGSVEAAAGASTALAGTAASELAPASAACLARMLGASSSSSE